RIYNHAGVQTPTHTYTAAGTYDISLMVINKGTTDPVWLYDTIVVGTPMAYNFGPDMYLCGTTDTPILRAPVVPGAKYLWNNQGVADTTDSLRVTLSGVYTVSINGCGLT